ncbi:MAG: bifunctional 4-hydroxy-2-oxoglutarate aldolase/2-dehydro-3-deoxy-phosphogluconate aldolase [Acidobacteriota bacterium]
MLTIQEILSRTPVVPVLTIHNADHAVPLAQALVAGGVPVLEVTLRTDCAFEAIRRIANELPEAIVGAGTVTRAGDLRAVRAAGARFVVSPGLTTAMADAARRAELPLLPGVMTPSEAMRARELGYRVLKLFPAEPAGGLPLVRALGGPLPDLTFCPTGGITAGSYRDYLALPNVLCVGGSWLAPTAAVAAGDWNRITQLAREATADFAPSTDAETGS